MSTPLDIEFKKSCETVKTLKTRPSEEELLELYALYKQAVIGDCNIKKPGLYDIHQKFKWAAWNKKKGLDKEMAKRQYIEFSHQLAEKYGIGQKKVKSNQKLMIKRKFEFKYPITPLL